MQMVGKRKRLLTYLSKHNLQGKEKIKGDQVDDRKDGIIKYNRF